MSASRTYDYATCSPIGGGGGLGGGSTRISTLPSLQRQGSFRNDYYCHLPQGATGGGASRAESPMTSGRESPRVLTHSASAGVFYQGQQRSGTPSSNGGASISKLLRKNGGLVAASAQERETMATNRFREVSACTLAGHRILSI